MGTTTPVGSTCSNPTYITTSSAKIIVITNFACFLMIMPDRTANLTSIHSTEPSVFTQSVGLQLGYYTGPSLALVDLNIHDLVHSNKDIDIITGHWTESILASAKYFIPFKIVKVYPRDRPWMISEIKQKMKKRDYTNALNGVTCHCIKTSIIAPMIWYQASHIEKLITNLQEQLVNKPLTVLVNI